MMRTIVSSTNQQNHPTQYKVIIGKGPLKAVQSIDLQQIPVMDQMTIDVILIDWNQYWSQNAHEVTDPHGTENQHMVEETIIMTPGKAVLSRI